MVEATGLCRELKAPGYGMDLGSVQAADLASAAKWMQDVDSKANFARAFLPEFVGDFVFEEVDPGRSRGSCPYCKGLERHG